MVQFTEEQNWVNLQKFLWKEGALWLPSVDELIIVFSLNELEFVSFSIDFFPTSYEIYMNFCKSSETTLGNAITAAQTYRPYTATHVRANPLLESPHLNKSSLYQIWNSWFDSTISGEEKLSKSSSGDSVVA